MVYDTISDNMVQIGISIPALAQADYDIVLKKHVSNIKEVSIQCSVAPGGAAFSVDDIASVPNVNVLTTGASGDILVHTYLWSPAVAPNLNVQQVGRIINISSEAVVAPTVLYLRILFDKAGDQ